MSKLFPDGAAIRFLERPLSYDSHFISVDDLERMQYNFSKNKTCNCGLPTVTKVFIPSVDRETVLVMSERSYSKLTTQIQKVLYGEKN